jgi:glycosyltransferase involved in cell wall biosynthesis
MEPRARWRALEAETALTDRLLFSIVIPCRNEAADIAETLEACLALDWERVEILVIDDSTDETPEIVLRYKDRGVRLIHREENRNGCCGARNLGMQLATGEIVVLVNADNRPSPDFLQRLVAHYQQGADFVIVRSQVRAPIGIWSRYLAAKERCDADTDPNWCEGFSCRRSAAQSVGFIPGDFPIPFCRDHSFGAALTKAGFKKEIDLTIVVEHVVPDTGSSFWQNRRWRGSFTAPYNYYLRHLPLPVVCGREVVRALRTVLTYLLVAPVVWRVARLARHAPRGWRDAPGLLAAHTVQELAVGVGTWHGLARLISVLHQEGLQARSSD